MKNIYIIRYENANKEKQLKQTHIYKEIIRHLQYTYKAKVLELAALILRMPRGKTSLNYGTFYYDMIDTIEHNKLKDLMFIIGITSIDIFGDKTKKEFVYGYGRVGSRTAIISTFRVNKNTTFLKNIVSHETAHALGLMHCDREACVLNERSTESERRMHSYEVPLCKHCKKKLEEKI